MKTRNMNKTKIVAIIVTYKGYRWYDRCFTSLRHSNVPLQTIVVDNASNDGTVEYIREKFPEIFIIESKENLGFAKANNIGIKYALEDNADYVFLLNQDAWIEENTLTYLLQTFEDSTHVGIASPMHLNGSYTGLDREFCDYVGPEFISDLFLGKLQSYYKIPMVNAAAWLVSRECIQKVGGFDSSLFKHYGEDDNYAQRVLYHGMKIILNTKSTICHDREQRTDKPIESMFNKGNPYFYYIHQQSNVLIEFNDFQVIQKKCMLLIISLLCLRFKRAKRLKLEIDIDKKIANSRNINITIGGGLKWLDAYL